MMTSRERVIRALTFDGPDRIPLGVMPPGYPSDFINISATDDPDCAPKYYSPQCWKDEFGCTWEKLHGDKTKGQVSKHPLTDYADLDKHRFPNYKNQQRYEQARQAVIANTEDKFILAHAPISLIHRLEYLRGHEAAWMDPYEHPEELRHLLNLLADIAIDAIDNFARIGVHGIHSSDDWGLQDRPMLHPDMFAEFWAPVYRRIYGHVRQLGLCTFLHSCGHIADLLPHFIDAELQVIQMDQQENMGVENLTERFGGKICFWCPVDIQSTMIKGTVEEVRASARRLIDNFGKFNGGFIAQWYASPEAVNHSQEKIDAMCQEFIDYGGKFYQKNKT